MKLRSLAAFGSFATGALVLASFAACGSSNSSGGGSGSDGGSSSGASSGGSSGAASSSGSSGGTSSSGSSGSGSSGGGSSCGSSSGGGSTSSGSSSGGFAPGTICNATGHALTAPATIKHVIVILEENENYGSVNGQSSVAPYINTLASDCAVATAYNDDMFSDNLVSCPHYLALTSGSNCSVGLDQGTGCVTTDETSLSQGTLTTTSIFQQVTSWKSYQEDMGTACNATGTGEYVLKHNPAVFYTQLAGAACTGNDLPITGLTCNASTTMTACGTPSNAFTDDLKNDTLAQFTFITPNLLNDMHDGTITQADNWLYTYVPLILASPAYLRGDVALQIIWDEQDTSTFGGPTPNVFISPYITKGTTSSTPMNHFALLRAWEKAFGITTFLGCAGGTPPGGSGTCPSDSTADVRAAMGW